MDVVSIPAVREETVRDLDVAYLGPQQYEFTLHAADTLHIASDELLVVKAGSQEEIHLLRKNMIWYSLRTRVIQTPILEPATPKADTPTP